VFFIDLDGHVEDEAVATALKELEVHTQLFRVLGSYPKAIL
jgi:chorismate mutase/prephenate dehydratase